MDDSSLARLLCRPRSPVDNSLLVSSSSARATPIWENPSYIHALFLFLSYTLPLSFMFFFFLPDVGGLATVDSFLVRRWLRPGLVCSFAQLFLASLSSLASPQLQSRVYGSQLHIAILRLKHPGGITGRRRPLLLYYDAFCRPWRRARQISTLE